MTTSQHDAARHLAAALAEAGVRASTAARQHGGISVDWTDGPSLTALLRMIGAGPGPVHDPYAARWEHNGQVWWLDPYRRLSAPVRLAGLGAGASRDVDEVLDLELDALATGAVELWHRELDACPDLLDHPDRLARASSRIAALLDAAA